MKPPIRVTLLTALAAVLSSAVPYTAPSGDLDRDGNVDATDLQCHVLVYQAITGAGSFSGDLCDTDLDCQAIFGSSHYCRPGLDKDRLCLPTCLHPQMALGDDPGILCLNPDADDETCLGTVPKHRVDMNCDGHLTNQDFLYHVAVLMHALGGPGSADHDGDGRLNFCDDDSDGDGDLDEVDCGILDATVGPTQPEVCNGQDENCNDKIDEYLGEISCGVSICAHSEPACQDGAPAVCDPFLGAQPETCNGVDDDCNDKIDDGEGETLCQDELLPPNGVMVGCVQGACTLTSCLPGWVDSNGILEDGCECDEDPQETLNGICSGATNLMTLPDSENGSLTLAVGNEPQGNGDWFRFSAQDIEEEGTDSFHVRIRFLTNPDDAFVFDVHYGSCEQAMRICSGADEMEWYTDFVEPIAETPSPSPPGPEAAGGGELLCAYDANQKLTPDKYEDDTSPGFHQCTDNSTDFYLRVYRLPGAKAPCQPYKIEISNGVYPAGP